MFFYNSSKFFFSFIKNYLNKKLTTVIINNKFHIENIFQFANFNLLYTEETLKYSFYD